jgi:hypothetical protein
MVAVLMVAIILNCVFAVLFFNVKGTQKKSGDYRLNVDALNIAETGKEKLYALVKSKLFVPDTNNHTVFNNVPFSKGVYTVTCKANVTRDTLLIHSTGVSGQKVKKLEINAHMTPKLKFNLPPTNLLGAITSRYTVCLNGNITVDGNDYDTNNVRIGNGIYGVYTCMTLSISQNGKAAAVGGNGIAPVNRGSLTGITRSTIVAENQTITSRFDSPEAFLGLAPGSLDEYKTSNLTTPFHGIVYVTGDCNSAHLDGCSGILIVHNVNKTAKLSMNANGTFKGLIICDVMDKINGTITVLGGVVALSDYSDSMFGNGNAKIHYSSQVLSNLEYFCDLEKVLSEASWREVL